jgi:hypothetical protein
LKQHLETTPLKQRQPISEPWHFVCTRFVSIIPTQIIPDSTRITVEFQVGPHAGKFHFEHLPPENLKLRQFFHKLKVWQADVAANAAHAEKAAKANAAL